MALSVEATNQILVGANTVWVTSLIIAWIGGMVGRLRLSDAVRINAFVVQRHRNITWVTVFLASLVCQRLYWLTAGAVAPLDEHYASWAHEWCFITLAFMAANAWAALCLADTFARRAFGPSWRLVAAGLLVCAGSAPFLPGI